MIQHMQMFTKDTLVEVYLVIAISFLHLLQSLKHHSLSEMLSILTQVSKMIVVYMVYIFTLEENNGLLLSMTISYSQHNIWHQMLTIQLIHMMTYQHLFFQNLLKQAM